MRVYAGGHAQIWMEMMHFILTASYEPQSSSDTKTENYSLKRFIRYLFTEMWLQKTKQKKNQRTCEEM